VEIVYERVAAIDVGKKVISVAVRTRVTDAGSAANSYASFNTYYRTLVAWLVAEGVTHVTMEPPGIRLGARYAAASGTGCRELSPPESRA
jgi:hypothetical protein